MATNNTHEERWLLYHAGNNMAAVPPHKWETIWLPYHKGHNMGTELGGKQCRTARYTI
jgi:hypothetical protein